MYSGKWENSVGDMWEFLKNGLIFDGDIWWFYKISCLVKKKLLYNLVNNNLSWKINGFNIFKGVMFYLK